MAATRLTGKRMNGLKFGYWTWAKKDEIVQRLGEYEDSGLTPRQIMLIIEAVPDLVKEIKGK